MKVQEILNTQWFEDTKSYFAISDLVFSRETYQLLLKDEREDRDFSCFIQFQNEEILSDAFCSCSQEIEVCDHVRFAVNSLYSHKFEPIHLRFENSFWNALFKYFAQQQGFFPDVMENQSGFSICDKHATPFLHLYVDSLEVKQLLEIILINRVKENESNSLKFSKLPFQELELFRQGRPSFSLSYELSLWADLAKFCFLRVEKGSFEKIRFHEEPGLLPQKLSVFFQGFHFEFTLHEDLISELIPLLNKIKSNLSVYEQNKQELLAYSFDPESKVLSAQYKKEAGHAYAVDKVKDQAIGFGSWYYLPHDGFFYKQDVGLQKALIPFEELSDFLDHNMDQVKRFLKGFVFIRQNSPMHVDLYFDEDWSLHIIPYLFEKDDLDDPGAFLLESFAFIPKKGFYRYSNFKAELKTSISAENIGQFLEQNRLWLGQFPGFTFHLSSVESTLEYRFDLEKGLQFGFLAYSKEDDKKAVKDFGKWIYIEGQGFFSKQQKSFSTQLSNITIPYEKVGRFILERQEDLLELPGFFLDECPVQEVGLKLNYKPDGLTITPSFKKFSKWQHKEIQLLGEVLYLENEGFYILPKQSQLKSEWLEKRHIPPKEFDRFFGGEYERIRPHLVSLDKELRPISDLSIQITHFEKKEKDRRKYVQVGLQMSSFLGEANFPDVLNAIKNRQKFLPSNAGLLDLRESIFSWIAEKQGIFQEQSPGLFSLSLLDFYKLFSFGKLEIAQQMSVFQKEAFEGLFDYQEDKPYQLTRLKGRLRPYQKVGVDWLWFLFQHQLSGLLCDDMGLGKTHQVMALIAALAHELDEVRILVVCPTSVLYHWKNKLDSHVPSVRVCFYHGANRDLKGFSKAKYSLLLTSYGICRQDKQALKELHFDLAVYDEVQVAKNNNSQIYKSLADHQSLFRLGLTGTPIENTLGELKTVFDLILPNYLPSNQLFKQNFTDPIERYHDEKQRKHLHRLVAPFILRRRKEEVLSDLPSKVEEKLFCEFADDQKSLYNKLISSYQAGLIRQLTQEDEKISYIHIFSLITKLKQICDHPGVFLGSTHDYSKYQSGKWNTFCDLLQQVQQSEQKVVVFSQYLGMLDIMEHHLKKQGISYATIRGSTQNREKEIEKFAKDKNCWVFLASLQAAGVGIDLTAASCVIHYDRWWNPAKEDQATDRVHRIGQTRGVQVFKLISKGSLEEKIDLIIEKKQALIQGLLQSTEEQVVKKLSRQELLDLFAQADMTA